MTTTQTPLLLVEDDKNLGYILSEYLGMKGFMVTWAKDGLEALAHIEKHNYSLCILDIMLPSMDGFAIAEKLSLANTRLPFIFLTAKSLKVDKLKAFKLGCDDYIVKPVDEEELVARINAVLKRTITVQQPGPAPAVTIGNTLFNFSTQSLEMNGLEFALTSRESAVLQLLIAHKNNLLNREMALKQVWGSNDYFNRRSMDVIISRLRKHLAADPHIKIVNIHGKGYMLQESI